MSFHALRIAAYNSSVRCHMANKWHCDNQQCMSPEAQRSSRRVTLACTPADEAEADPVLHKTAALSECLPQDALGHRLRQG